MASTCGFLSCCQGTAICAPQTGLLRALQQPPALGCHVWQQQFSSVEGHGTSSISWPQGKVWSKTWHFLFEMLICISFRFIKAVGKHVRERGGALFIFVLLIVSVKFHGSERCQSWIFNVELRQCGTQCCFSLKQEKSFLVMKIAHSMEILLGLRHWDS